ncbi:MAG: hypothetical protein IJS60_07500, partial [Abditibacteriota bacterium]|nr:hypothetical protein [Abditibacteriota bacterium]
PKDRKYQFFIEKIKRLKQDFFVKQIKRRQPFISPIFKRNGAFFYKKVTFIKKMGAKNFMRLQKNRSLGAKRFSL